MAESVSSSHLFSRLFKWLGIVLLSLLCICALFVVILPHLIATEWFEGWIERKGTEFLHRPVHIGKIRCSWADGITVEGLRVDDFPAMSDRPLIAVDSGEFTMDLGRFYQRSLHFTLKLEGLDLRIIRDVDGNSNLQLLLSQITGDQKRPEAEKPAHEKEGLSFPLPLEISGRLHAENMVLVMEDRGQGRTLRFKNSGIDLSVPRVSTGQPVTLLVSTEPELDGRALAPLSIDARLGHLFDAQGAVDLGRAFLEVRGELPGCRVELDNDMREMRGKGRIEIDLHPLWDVLRPFLTVPLADTMLAGKLSMTMKYSGDLEKCVLFDVALNGEAVTVSGGLLKGRHLGPLAWSGIAQGTFQPVERRLSVENGTFEMGNSQLDWCMTVDHPAAEANLQIGPAFFDLGEIYGFATDLIPQPAGFEAKEISAVAELGGLNVSALLSSDRSVSERVKRVDLRGLVLTSPVLRVGLGQEVFSAKDTRISVHHIGAESIQGPSNDLAVTAALDIGELAFQAERGWRVKGLAVPALEAWVRLEAVSPREATIDAALHLDEVESVGREKGSLKDFALSRIQASSTFHEGFPKQAHITAAMNMGVLRLEGESALLLKGLRVPSLDAAMSEIRRSDEARFGIASELTLTQSLVVEQLSIPSVATITDADQRLDARLTMDSMGGGNIVVRDLSVNLPSVLLENIPDAPVRTSARLETKIDRISLSRGSNPSVDIDGLQSQVAVEDFLDGRLLIHAKNSAFDQLTSEGEIALGPGISTHADLLPSSLRKVEWKEGMMRLNWNIAGRLPDSDEFTRLAQDPLERLTERGGIGFVDAVEVSAALDDVELNLFSEGLDLENAKVSTTKPLKISLEKGLDRTRVEGGLSLKNLQWGGLPAFTGEPVDALFSFSGSADQLESFRLAQKMDIAAFNLTQGIRVELADSGLLFKPMLRGGSLPSLASIVKKLRGSIQGEVEMEEGRDLARVKRDISLDGPLKTGFVIRFIPGQEVSARGWLKTTGLSARLGEDIAIRGLQSQVELNKRYGSKAQAVDKEVRLESLSGEVLRPESGGTEHSDAESQMVRRIISDLRGRGGGTPALSFQSARIPLGPLWLELSNHVMDFQLNRGLPSVEYFQTDLLGGNVNGALLVSKGENRFLLETRASFSGLNAKRLFPRAVHGVSDEEAEITGLLSMSMPLSSVLTSMLSSLRLTLRLTHIGSQAFERILYALDPYESNEAIVNQRKYLRTGTPRWIEANVQHGSLSISGEVQVKGIRMELPPIKRLNLASLPGLREVDRSLNAMEPVLELLRILAADSMIVQEGELRFVSKGE